MLNAIMSNNVFVCVRWFFNENWPAALATFQKNMEWKRIISGRFNVIEVKILITFQIIHKVFLHSDNFDSFDWSIFIPQ